MNTDSAESSQDTHAPKLSAQRFVQALVSTAVDGCYTHIINTLCDALAEHSTDIACDPHTGSICGHVYHGGYVRVHVSISVYQIDAVPEKLSLPAELAAFGARPHLVEIYRVGGSRWCFATLYRELRDTLRVAFPSQDVVAAHGITTTNTTTTTMTPSHTGLCCTHGDVLVVPVDDVSDDSSDDDDTGEDLPAQTPSKSVYAHGRDIIGVLEIANRSVGYDLPLHSAEALCEWSMTTNGAKDLIAQCSTDTSRTQRLLQTFLDRLFVSEDIPDPYTDIRRLCLLTMQHLERHCAGMVQRILLDTPQLPEHVETATLATNTQKEQEEGYASVDVLSAPAPEEDVPLCDLKSQTVYRSVVQQRRSRTPSPRNRTGVCDAAPNRAPRRRLWYLFQSIRNVILAHGSPNRSRWAPEPDTLGIREFLRVALRLFSHLKIPHHMPYTPVLRKQDVEPVMLRLQNLDQNTRTLAIQFLNTCRTM